MANNEDFHQKVMHEDLNLAAELGKALLYQNKELQASIKQYQTIVDDQVEEIKYLTKQTTALREVNDSRIQIYEQLEISIQNLEKENHQFATENSAYKKEIKKLNATIQSLEEKCEELQRNKDEIQKKQETVKKEKEVTVIIKQENKNEQPPDIQIEKPETTELKEQIQKSVNVENKISNGIDKTETSEPEIIIENVDETLQLLKELQTLQLHHERDERKITELEEQLAVLSQENNSLEQKIVAMSQVDLDNVSSIHDEINTLNEIKQEQLCIRCLQFVQKSAQNDLSISSKDYDGQESVQSSTIDGSFYSCDILDDLKTPENQDQKKKKKSTKTPKQFSESNTYREMCNKLEASIEEKRNKNKQKNINNLSLQDELIFCKANSETDSSFISTGEKEQVEGDISSTTINSETVTENLDKSIQTEQMSESLLCTVADGGNHKLKIYNDSDNRFGNIPEYLEVFDEIYAVLKKAAHKAEKGEKLPLLDENSSEHSQTSAVDSQENEESEQTNVKTVLENSEQSTNDNKVEIKEKTPENKPISQEPTLTPYKKEALDFISVSVGIRKKPKKKLLPQYRDRSESPVLPLSPKISYCHSNRSRSKRRDFKPIEHASRMNVENHNWNGNTMCVWSSHHSPDVKSSQGNKDMQEFKRSTASQNLHRLRNLEHSYAEVLRRTDLHKAQLHIKTNPYKK